MTICSTERIFNGSINDRVLKMITSRIRVCDPYYIEKTILQNGFKKKLKQKNLTKQTILKQ